MTGSPAERQTIKEPHTPRERFRRYMAGEPVDHPPLFEHQIPMETLVTWTRQGYPEDISPYRYFALEERERVPIRASRVDLGVKPVVDMRSARNAAGRYFSDVLKQYPPAWPEVREALEKSENVVYADAYPRGFLQEMGIKDSQTLHKVLLALRDEPRAAEYLMRKYADFLVEVIRNRYHGLDIEYFFYSEPVAHPRAPVISPDAYKHFVAPLITRVVHEGQKIGVKEHVLWTTGDVRPLIPIWIEAGINGLWIGHAAALRISYLQLRKKYGPQISLWGGVDNRILYQDTDAIDKEVKRIYPLLSSGRYLPMIDDTIRPEIPLHLYKHYRSALEALMSHR